MLCSPSSRLKRLNPYGFKAIPFWPLHPTKVVPIEGARELAEQHGEMQG
jgi:hypothetical protein